MSFLWFPPRLIEADDTILDPSLRVDDAVSRYLNEAIAIPTDESHIRNAQKVIAFAEQFTDLAPEPEERACNECNTYPCSRCGKGWRCDCWKVENQVCDICQAGLKDDTPELPSCDS
jgi:hypothetical protein